MLKHKNALQALSANNLTFQMDYLKNQFVNNIYAKQIKTKT